MKVLFLAATMVAMMSSMGAAADELLKPTKIPMAQAAGPIFNGPTVQHEGPSGAFSNVELLNSHDKHFTVGLFKAGASDFAIESYPEDEFCYFLSGRVKLTSTDGTVLELKAGDAVVIPKGWKGRWTTSGYSKYYAVYNTEASKGEPK